MQARAVLLALVAGALALSAGSEPFVLALRGGLAPGDLANDFVAARELVAGRPLYTPAQGRMQAELVAAPESVTPYYAHPPLVPLLLSPLVGLGFTGAAALWWALSLWLLAMLGAIVVQELHGPQPASLALRLGALAGLLVWPPVLYNLDKGQWSILLAALTAFGWRALARGHAGRGGAWIGLACALKVTPGGFLPYLALRSRRGAAAAVGTLLACVGVSMVAVGPAGWAAFLRQGGRNVSAWEGWLSNTLSLNGFFARLLIGGRYETPLVHAPLAARAAFAGGGALLVAVALRATWRTAWRTAWRPAGRTASDTPREGALFGLWAILVVLLNPLAWGHGAVMLLLPAALVVRCLAEDAQRHAAERRRLLALMAAGILLVSIPIQTLHRAAGPVPVSPLGSLAVLSLPFYGVLLLFAAALAAIRRT